MNEKYYAYYKPNSKVELMNDIKQQLLEEYDSITANKILSQIFTNINCNDTDEYLACFQLLKSRTKLHQQDQIWKNICKDLNWEYINSL